MLGYCKTIVFSFGSYLFKVNNKNTRKRCEVSQKLTKKLPKKVCLQNLSDSDIYSSSCEEGDFSGSDTNSGGEL